MKNGVGIFSDAISEVLAANNRALTDIIEVTCDGRSMDGDVFLQLASETKFLYKRNSFSHPPIRYVIKGSDFIVIPVYTEDDWIFLRFISFASDIKSFKGTLRELFGLNSLPHYDICK